MNNPNNYHNTITETCKACLKELLQLFHENGITELEVTEKVCQTSMADRCYCTIWDQYSNNNVEAVVEKVQVKGNHLSLNYLLDGTEYNADLDEIKMTDLPSIYECCYNMLVK